MPRLGFLVQPATTPAAGRAADRALLVRAVERGWGAVRVSACAGDVLALGRWHLAPRGAPDVGVHRRLTGGRAAASGTGFVHVSLALPHRSALVSDESLALAPEQVLNRAVRGLLGALEAAGMPAIYPGRDLVTVARRPIAVLGLEVDDAGATLVEAVLAVERDQALLPVLLDRADPDGVVPAAMMQADDVTALARELGRTPCLDEVARWLRTGFETRLGAELVEEPALAVAADDEATFVRSRVRAPALDRWARTATMLGVLEAYGVRAGDGTIAAVLLAGDLLAPSGTIARLEGALRGCPADAAHVAAVLARVVRPPRDFILGVGPLGTVADTVARAFA